LPLTHAADAIWTAAFGAVPRMGDYLILGASGAAAFVFAILTLNRARD
jgi:hypothetical protein